MTDRPIIFSGAMVRALLAGTKTQTRRLATSPLRRCEVGDRLYVRESYRISPDAGEAWDPTKTPCIGWLDYMADRASLEVAAPDFEAVARVTRGIDWDFVPDTWKPSIHMPRWASRLTLNVTDVRTEGLQEINDAQAQAEGVIFRSWEVEEGKDCEIVEGWSSDRYLAFKSGVGETPRDGYELLWNSLHADTGQRWQDNPEVVAVTFAVGCQNIDHASGAI